MAPGSYIILGKYQILVDFLKRFFNRFLKAREHLASKDVWDLRVCNAGEAGEAGNAAEHKDVSENKETKIRLEFYKTFVM